MRSIVWMMVLAAALASGAARADELQVRLVVAAKAVRAEDYRFKRTITVEATGETRKTFVEQYDPRAAAAARWTLVSVDGRAPTAKELASARKNKRGPTPSYARLAEWVGAAAVRSDAGPGYVLYKFTRLPAGTVKFGSHDASADTRAEALVNVKGRTPFVERTRFTSSTGFRMMLVASVKSLAFDNRYQQLPDGSAVPDASDSVIAGSMLAKSGQMRTKVNYTGFERVR